MFNNKSDCIILGLIIVILLTLLFKNLLNDKRNIKENFYQSVLDNIVEIKDDINTLNFQQDLNQGKTNRNKSLTNKNSKNIVKLNRQISTDLNQIKDTQLEQQKRIDNTEKTNLMVDTILSEDGDIPNQGRMLNRIIDSGNIERDKWSRDFYDLKKKQEIEQTKNQNILNELLKERKELKELVKNSQEKISEQTNKFTQGINNLGQFHDNYQKELESILKRKYNLSQDSFELNEKVQESRIKKLNKDLEQINSLKKKITGIEDNESRSVKCLATGDKLNIRPVEFNGNPTGKYIIFLNNGCLSFKKSGVYDTDSCELSDLQQHFIINEVTNYEEYNKLINIVNDGTKEFVFEKDNISYPFKVISHFENLGECLTVSEEGISIEPIINSANQRFVTSLIPSTANCKSKFE